MTTRARARSDFEDFVVVCSDRLLRTAFLLTGDPDRAEELLQDALARAWAGWRHLEDQPEPAVRRILVGRATTWWRRSPGTATGPLAGLTPRQRALVVLRVVDDLSEEDTADLLGCSVATVQVQTARALAALGVEADVRQGTPA